MIKPYTTNNTVSILIMNCKSTIDTNITCISWQAKPAVLEMEESWQDSPFYYLVGLRITRITRSELIRYLQMISAES
jgi:hypothetical protein